MRTRTFTIIVFSGFSLSTVPPSRDMQSSRSHRKRTIPSVHLRRTGKGKHRCFGCLQHYKNYTINPNFNSFSASLVPMSSKIKPYHQYKHLILFIFYYYSSFSFAVFFPRPCHGLLSFFFYVLPRRSRIEGICEIGRPAAGEKYGLNFLKVTVKPQEACLVQRGFGVGLREPGKWPVAYLGGTWCYEHDRAGAAFFGPL